MADVIWILIPLTALMIPITAIYTSHKRSLIEMQLKMGRGDQNVLAEIAEIKRQITEIRDTSTRYDMSFDAALQRIESRVGNLEGRMSAVEQQTNITR